MSQPQYAVRDVEKIASPALLFFRERIESNLERMINIAGSPDRLCPHVKTHKCPNIVQLELARGIRHHKCATLAEAVMLAEAGAASVLVAYPLVGPNCRLFAEMVRHFPKTRFAVIADHPAGLEALSAAAVSLGVQVEVLLDLDVGQHRTGVPCGETAVSLYEKITRSANCKACSNSSRSAGCPCRALLSVAHRPSPAGPRSIYRICNARPEPACCTTPTTPGSFPIWDSPRRRWC
jgi:D-serine deaminase-like pyridoxal phosphate-dependent protein